MDFSPDRPQIDAVRQADFYPSLFMQLGAFSDVESYRSVRDELHRDGGPASGLQAGTATHRERKAQEESAFQIPPVPCPMYHGERDGVHPLEPMRLRWAGRRPVRSGGSSRTVARSSSSASSSSPRSRR